MDVQHDIPGRQPVTLWTYDMWPWSSTSFYMDVQHYIAGRPSASVWTSNMRLWTSTRFYMDIKNDIGGPPPASIWAYNILPRMSTSFIKDEQHVTVAQHMDVIMKSVDVYQFLYFVWTYYMRPWTSTCVYIDVKHDVDVHQFLYWLKTTTTDVYHFLEIVNANIYDCYVLTVIRITTVAT